MKLFKISETSFENYDSTIKKYLSKMLGSAGQQYSHSQIFGTIFDGIKSIMQNVMFYIEDAMTEQNINTAYRTSSVYSLAKLSGYEPFYGSAASGIVECKISPNAKIKAESNKVYLKNGSSIVNNITGYSYLIYLPSDYYVIDLSKPLSSYTFKIVEGKYKTTSYVCQGEPLETLHVFTSGLFDREYIEVRVDGELYSPAACLYDMTKDSKEYVVSVGYNNELDIMFGNGTYGKKLNNGQNVTIKYISHSGTQGNIKLDSEHTLMLTSDLYDIYGNSIKAAEYLELTLMTSISGGSDADSIDTVRKMIGYTSRSLVLANEDNYKLFLKRFSFIGQSNIWCENNSLIVNAVCTTNFKNDIADYNEYFSAADNNKILLSDYQKEMVVSAINNSNKTYAGVTLNFVDPIIYKYAILMYLKVPSSYNKDIVKSEISKLIADYFISLPSNTTFVSKSDIIKLVLDNNPYIESLDITFVSDVNEKAKYNGYYYDYKKVNVDNTWTYEYTKNIYNGISSLGIDDFGNIKLENKFAVPVISNNVTYCIDNERSKDTFSIPEAIQFLFI